MEIKILKELLTKIKSIKKVSKILTFLIIIPLVLILILSSTTGTSTQVKASPPLAAIILICLIILLVKSCSIHFDNITNYETKEIIRSYKSKAIVCSVLAIILIFFFWIMTIIIWVMSKGIIRFLEEKIEEQKQF